jgi:glycosyltransferase involved in cell wall biosynthesis
LPNLKVVYQVWGPEAAEYIFANGSSDRPEAGVSAEASRLDGLQRRAMREADAIVSISAAMTRWAVDEYEADPARIVEIPCFVDTDRFRPAPQHRSAVRRELGLGDRFTVVYAGSLFRWQFPDGCFDVLRAVRARIPDAHFLAVTTSPEAMRTRLAEHAFPEDATTVVSVPYEHVSRYLAAADLAILGRGLGEQPSLVNGISSPVKFSEYLACGVPVVLSEGIGDFSDAAREHELGVVIPCVAGSGVISRQVAEFLAQYRASAGSFRERCRAFACEHLAIDKHVERLGALYQELRCR